MRVGVIGTGYVGLVSAACLAHLGHRVTAVDVDAAKIARLAAGAVDIHEPGLDALVQSGLDARRLRFSTDIAHAAAADVVLIAVGTPAAAPGFADLGYVMSAARAVGAHVAPGSVVVVKSTVPPGTGARIEQAIAAALVVRGAVGAVPVASNPEFLREGAALGDFLAPDRIVVGADDPRAHDALRRLYVPLTERGHALLTLDRASAELAKYAANAMLALRISAANELAAVAEACGADWAQVRAVVGSDARIGPAFLAAGVGYGGSCFPKDLRALARIAEDAGVEPTLVRATERVNQSARSAFRRKIERWAATRGGLAACTFALWGLAFKPGTDDLREAPALELLAALAAAGARVQAHDPVALDGARRLLGELPGVTWAATAADALAGADALVLMTEWPQYAAHPVAELAAALRAGVVFDGRNALDPTACAAAGLRHVGVGRATAGGEPTAARAALA
jgi:UDPglucose 6-dehydrogenase